MVHNRRLFENATGISQEVMKKKRALTMDPSRMNVGGIDSAAFKERVDVYNKLLIILAEDQRAYERMLAVETKILDDREEETRKYLGSSVPESEVTATLAKLSTLLDGPRPNPTRNQLPPTHCLPMMSDYSGVHHRLSELHKKMHSKYITLKHTSLAQYMKYI